MFEHMYAVGKRVGGIVGAHFTTGLEDDFTAINLLIDIVYGNTALGVTGGKNSLVYMMTIHARTSVTRHQRGVYVDDATGIDSSERALYFAHKSCQNNQVYLFLLQHLYNVMSLAPHLFGKGLGRDVKLLHTLVNTGIGTIG